MQIIKMPQPLLQGLSLQGKALGTRLKKPLDKGSIYARGA